MSLELTMTVAIGVIAILVEVILFLWKRREKDPIWYYRTRRIVGPGPKPLEDITIMYKGRAVPRVSITKIAIVNSGRGLIRDYDVTKPILITTGEDVSILREPGVKVSRPDIKFSATWEESGIKVEFDQLDYLDGGVIEVIHTGDKDAEFNLGGTIAGVRKGIRKISLMQVGYQRRRAFLAMAILALVMAALFLGVLIPEIKSQMAEGKTNIPDITLGVIWIGAFIALLVFSLLRWRKTVPTHLNVED